MRRNPNMPNFNQIRQAVDQLKQNPLQILNPRFNIPRNINLNDPNSIIQHLLNTGQIQQQDVDQIMNQRNNPIFRGFK